jgi:hypothetical protein
MDMGLVCLEDSFFFASSSMGEAKKSGLPRSRCSLAMTTVIPAQAEIQYFKSWMPAFADMVRKKILRRNLIITQYVEFMLLKIINMGTL